MPVKDPVIPMADKVFAPRWGKRGGCENCQCREECERRRDLDLWPLCCLPTRREVALAYIDGRLAIDGKLPRWLPDLVEKMTR